MRQPTRLFILAAIAAALTACGPSTDTTITTDTTTTTAPATTTPASPAGASPTTAAVNLEPLGVKDASEIKFQPLPESTEPANGYFDAVNNNVKPEHTLPKTDVLTLNGWAIIPSNNKPANQVVITEGDQNAVIAIAPVGAERTDVATTTNNPSYKNSGWNLTIDPSILPSDKAVLKAWAFNAETKEAFQLSPVHIISFNQ